MVIRDSDLYLLVQCHSCSTFQDTWVALNLTNYCVMVCYSNLAYIWTDILYPRAFWTLSYLRYEWKSVMNDVGAMTNQSSIVIFSDSEFLYLYGDEHFLTWTGEHLSHYIPHCFSGFLNSFCSCLPTHASVLACYCIIPFTHTSLQCWGWLSYCTHSLQSAPGFSPTDFSPSVSPDLHGIQLFRLLFSLCIHLLSLRPTFLFSARDWYLIDCSVTPPVSDLTFSFQMLLWKWISFRLIRPISSSRTSCSELLLYFHSISALPTIPFFIACFILWVLEILLWIMLHNWFLLHNIHFSTMYCRNEALCSVVLLCWVHSAIMLKYCLGLLSIGDKWFQGHAA